jgi:hypothetical protein
MAQVGLEIIASRCFGYGIALGMGNRQAKAIQTSVRAAQILPGWPVQTGEP